MGKTQFYLVTYHRFGAPDEDAGECLMVGKDIMRTFDKFKELYPDRVCSIRIVELLRQT